MSSGQRTSGDRSEDGESRGQAPIDLELGEVIAGKYTIERLLGRGGMGTVWLCLHAGLHERFAVKVMSRLVAESAEVRARFEREARASAKINSRYVARVHDTGELPDGRPYLVMEYMVGETLGQALRAAPARTMSLVDTARVLGQVGRGLARAHELGIVHRDIKPDNVFLAHTADDGVIAKVFDFGIVKLSDAIAIAADQTQEGALLGTPQYMSPEQVEGLAIDHRSDIYAVGVMAFRMLTGKRLFPGDSLSSTLMSICNGPLPSLTEAAPSLPPAIEAWFQKTCAREREARFDSAVECVEALAALAGVGPSLDASIPPPRTIISGVVPAMPSSPLETPSGLSAVRLSRPAMAGPPTQLEVGPTLPPERSGSRRGIVLGVLAVAGLLVVLLVFLTMTKSAPTSSPAPNGLASSAMSAPQPAPAAPSSSSSPSPAPPSTLADEATPAAAAPSALAPDAATRGAPRRPPPRRRDAPRPGAPSKPDDAPPDGIHDVGY